MITIITGIPGTGKTAYAIDSIFEERGKIIDIDGVPTERRLFVEGVQDLAIEHEPSHGMETWHEWAPDGAVLVLDEAQKVFRPRHSASAVPPAVQEMEEHRHRAIDIILITQHPALLDSNVRRLCGRHIHIRKTALGRYLHEWPEVNDPDSKAARDVSATRRFNPPKRVFNKYKSASGHTTTKTRLPMAFYILIGTFLIFAGLAYYAYNSIFKRVMPGKPADISPAHTTHIDNSTGVPVAAMFIKGWFRRDGHVFAIITDGSKDKLIKPNQYVISGTNLEITTPGEAFAMWVQNNQVHRP